MSASINYPPASESISESDDPGIRTPTTTTVYTTAHYLKDNNIRTWTPSDGSTTIIRSFSSGNVITLLDEEVVLAPLGSRGSLSMYWECVEIKGWLGFRNVDTKKFLCHHRGNSELKCTAEEGSSCRHFTITPVPNGGHVMQMLDWWTLRSVVIKEENGLQKLARTGDKIFDGVVWEFVKIELAQDRVRHAVGACMNGDMINLRYDYF